MKVLAQSSFDRLSSRSQSKTSFGFRGPTCCKECLINQLDRGKICEMASRGRPRCFSCHRPVQEREDQRCTYCRVLRFCSARCLDRSWDTHAPICKSIQKKWKRAKDVSLPPAKAKANLRLVCFACDKAPATSADIGRCGGCRAVPFCKTAACQVRTFIHEGFELVKTVM